MRITLILLLSFTFNLDAFSQMEDQSVTSNLFLQKDSSLFDLRAPKFEEMINQSILKSNLLLRDSVVNERLVRDPWSEPRMEKTVDIYGYDEKGSINKIIIQTFKYIWNEDFGAWVKSTKTEYSTDGNFKQRVLYSWDNIGHNWRDTVREEYTYNEKRKLLLYIKLNWNGSYKIWEGSTKTEAQYFVNGLLSNQIVYNWDIENNDWQYQKKTEAKLDSNGYYQEIASYNWYYDSARWLESIKYETIYEPDGRLSQEIIYQHYWYSNSVDWFPYSKTNYITYYPNGLEKQFSVSSWSSAKNEWTPPTLVEYERTFDDKGYQILYISRHKEYNNDNWELLRKEQYAYNTNGRLTSQIKCEWDKDSNDWFCSYKAENIYDENDNLILYTTSHKTKDRNEWEWVQKQVNNYNEEGYLQTSFSFFWEINLNDWELIDKNTYYYSEYVTSNINNKVNAIFTAYPNPANETLRFYTENKVETDFLVEIFDLKGNKVISKILFGNSLSVSELKNGIYFYQLTTSNKIVSGKFVVQH